MVRTLTALDRLRDMFSALADDFRLEIRFAVATGSEFAIDLRGHLDRCEMRVVEWEQATSEHFDLAVSPNSNGKLHELDIPLMTLPHGAGYHKYRPTGEGFTDEVSGLSRTQLTHAGRVVPSILGLSHDDQLDLLRMSCPEALGHARIIGDPCYDRLLASLPAREHYQRALGTDSRRLVLVCSTWGPDSLFGRQPELASRLVNALPSETYRVGLVLHPNIWDRHSAYQIRHWTTRARAAGLLLLPPQQGWQAALVAADRVVSDHGSLAFYAAALRKPLLLAEFGDTEIVRASPMATLGELARRLDPHLTLRTQVDDAKPVPDHELLAVRAFARPGEAAALLRRAVYERLQLPEPSWPAPTMPVDLYSP